MPAADSTRRVSAPIATRDPNCKHWHVLNVRLTTPRPSSGPHFAYSIRQTVWARQRSALHSALATTRIVLAHFEGQARHYVQCLEVAVALGNRPACGNAMWANHDAAVSEHVYKSSTFFPSLQLTSAIHVPSLLTTLFCPSLPASLSCTTLHCH
jgi:hypothetical protein